MQCQFCQKMLEDVEAVQLHQVTSCPAINGNRSSSFENVIVNETIMDEVETEEKVSFKLSEVMDEYSHVVLEDISKHSSENCTINDDEVNGSKTLDSDGENEYSEIDVDDLLKTYWQLYDEKQSIEKQLQAALQTIEGKERRLSIMLEDNEFIRNENQKLKNERKQWKQDKSASVLEHCNVSDTVESDVSLKLKTSTEELNCLREELAEFRKFVYDELTYIKSGRQPVSSVSTTEVGEQLHHEVSPSVTPVVQQTTDNAISNSTVDSIFELATQHTTNQQRKTSRHVPGNSTYADMTKHGKKVAIISDSMCRGVKTYKLNRGLEGKFTYKKVFPGATPADLNYYCVRTLEKDKPDICIIHGGTNRIGKDDPFTIAREIINTVKTCKEKGSNMLFVSGVVNRPDFPDQVKQLNNILYQWQFLHDYRLFLMKIFVVTV